MEYAKRLDYERSRLNDRAKRWGNRLHSGLGDYLTKPVGEVLKEVGTTIENIIDTISAKSNRDKMIKGQGEKYYYRSVAASFVRGAIIGGIIGYWLSPDYGELTVPIFALPGAVVDAVQNNIRTSVALSKLRKGQKRMQEDQRIRGIIQEEIAKPDNTQLMKIIQEEIVKYHQQSEQ